MFWLSNTSQKDRNELQRNVNDGADVIKKGLAIVGGAVLAVGGLVLAVCTDGLAPILIGSAMVGAGVSSTWNGTEKVIKGERIDGRTYVADMAFGAITGLATGGMGIAGETIANNIAEEGVIELAVRAATGIVTGITAKAIDEIKQCLTNDKKWSDYGKCFDENGNENGTSASWISSATVGGLGGASSYISSKVSETITSDLIKSVTRVIVSGTTAAVSDATMQSINIIIGNQDKYDVKRTFTAATTSAIMTAAQEGTKNAIHQFHSTKETLLLVEEDISKEDRCENLKKISQSILNNEGSCTLNEGEKPNPSWAINKYDPEIQLELDLKKSIIRKHGGNVMEKSDNNHARFLIGAELSIHTDSIDMMSRKPIRTMLDCDMQNSRRMSFQFSSDESRRRFSQISSYDDIDHYKVYENQSTRRTVHPKKRKQKKLRKKQA